MEPHMVCVTLGHTISIKDKASCPSKQRTLGGQQLTVIFCEVELVSMSVEYVVTNRQTSVTNANVISSPPAQKKSGF